jgi:hypothetical protein
MKKTIQCRVRLASTHESGAAAQIAFSEEEYNALRNVAVSLGYGNRRFSAMLRDVSEKAALAGRSESEHHTIHGLLQSAADDARLSLGAWMRLCALSAAGLSPLHKQLKAVAPKGAT